MNTLMKATGVIAALALASPLAARPVSLSVQMKNYSGNRAYAVIYLVGPDGEYVSTLHVAGKKSKYQADMRRWYRMARRSARGIDGTTGASAGSGASLHKKFDIPDAMFDAGYSIRVESAVENRGYYADDARISISSNQNGKSVRGTGYVSNLSIKF